MTDITAVIGQNNDVSSNAARRKEIIQKYDNALKFGINFWHYGNDFIKWTCIYRIPYYM